MLVFEIEVCWKGVFFPNFYLISAENTAIQVLLLHHFVAVPNIPLSDVSILFRRHCKRRSCTILPPDRTWRNGSSFQSAWTMTRSRPVEVGRRTLCLDTETVVEPCQTHNTKRCKKNKYCPKRSSVREHSGQN